MFIRAAKAKCGVWRPVHRDVTTGRHFGCVKYNDVIVTSYPPAVTPLYFADFDLLSLRILKSSNRGFRGSRKPYAEYEHLASIFRGSWPGRHSAVSHKGRHSEVFTNMCVCVCVCVCVCTYPVNYVCICASTISQMNVSEPDQISEYGTGLINVHEEHMMFSVGLWFRISIDSAILSSAMSLQVWSIEIERVFCLISSLAWQFMKCSPKGVFFVLFLASRRCSLKRSLTLRLLSPI